MRPSRLLLVSYYFPPNATVSAFRVRRLVVEMARRGWQVRAIAARRMYQPVLDESLCEGLEVATVTRTHAANPGDWLRRFRGGDAAASPVPSVEEAPTRRSWRQRARGIVSALQIPDGQAGWLPFAMFAGMRGERPDVVLATVPSFTNLVVATLLSYWHRAALVLDYRDPWNALVRSSELPAFRRRIDDALERWALRRASGLVTTTHGLAKEIGAQAGRTVEVVHNACEPERFSGIEPRRFARPTIVYAGGLYGGRRLDPVLDALASLRDAGRIEPDRLQLLYMGRSSDQVVGPVASKALEAFVCDEGVRTNRQALEATLGAACNLTLVGPEHVRQVPAKIFEHVAARRPMLVVAPRGSDTEALLAPFSFARCLPDDDPKALQDALLEIADGALGAGGDPIPDTLTTEATMDAFDRILRRACAGGEAD